MRSDTRCPLVGLHLSVLKLSLCRTLLLSSDQRMNFRGAAELLSGDDKAMQANNLAGLNECAADSWLSIPVKALADMYGVPPSRIGMTSALQREHPQGCPC